MEHIYDLLHKAYGPQRWWPVVSSNPQFEIMLGAILTQNTAWANVEKAIAALDCSHMIDEKKLANTRLNTIAELIRPTGYYNQKAKRLRIFARWYLENKARLGHLETNIIRERLLSLEGIGPETADSILLYALNRPIFVIDAYTRRIFSRLGYLSENSKYSAWQELFMGRLKPDTQTFNDYHALIVEHAKRNCQKTPICHTCILQRCCAGKRLNT